LEGELKGEERDVKKKHENIYLKEKTKDTEGVGFNIT
jgi:hypothetical protein